MEIWRLNKEQFEQKLAISMADMLVRLEGITDIPKQAHRIAYDMEQQGLITPLEKHEYEVKLVKQLIAGRAEQKAGEGVTDECAPGREACAVENEGRV